MGIGIGGTMPMRAILKLQFFGMRSFAIIQGLLLIFVTLGTIVSPPFAGWVYDTFKNYQVAWLSFAIFTLITIPTVFFSVKPKANWS